LVHRSRSDGTFGKIAVAAKVEPEAYHGMLKDKDFRLTPKSEKNNHPADGR
jgi:hypothetical protein